ncbi:NTP/NDP exchange transporter [Algibacter sp. L4_22]|uniref:NTP/NDP exchange transporter n=1 Tax=Algibacter sp. L4_22 TaxID=2942477 RepID=UPI00201B724C|nr:Npt1/Npt2 family nucleotide transporter [Algibacter sp. L4_22]MCL5130307.1 MFS transporter [Algibacter sp. L4_22]
MIKIALKKVFDIRDGELKIALLMQGYIFLVIATLLIIKPTISALFISELGAENLPYGYLLVAITAVISSYFYSKTTERFPLNHIIKFTLLFSIISLVILGTLLHLNLIKGWVLYGFYTGVAIYAVLATSQFWILANLVFNVREAKRLFGFIGAGAITGGIFGGYLTTILAPFIGNENLIFVAAFFLILCFPLLDKIWKTKVSVLNVFKQKKRISVSEENPLKLILSSNHLTYLAAIIAVGVITARLVDYQFSYIAGERITDSDELTSFFGFWLSSFNVASLFLQLFLTRKIVGVWGVGFSLLLLPILVFLGGLLFFVFPELWVVILLKASDASLKQSINKSAVELIALPLPFQLKKRTKSYIDVVVDSIATGIAGCILIFLIKGLDVSPMYIMVFIVLLTFTWTYFVFKVRKEYFLSFKKNLEAIVPVTSKRKKALVSNESFLKGMYNVFQNGEESEILFMLDKAKEINDKRLITPISGLLNHPSNKVKAEALRNLFFLNEKSIYLEVKQFLNTQDDNLVMATLEYLLLHADHDETIVFDSYLDHEDHYIADAALLCLAKESRDNYSLRVKYDLFNRIENKKIQIVSFPDELQQKEKIKLLSLIGFSDYKKSYQTILDAIENNSHPIIQKEAIVAAGNTINVFFVDALLYKLLDKTLREVSIKALTNYGNAMVLVLKEKLFSNDIAVAVKRFIPKVMAAFNSQNAVDTILISFKDSEDLSVRLECVAQLSKLKETNSTFHFNEKQVAKLILEECKLYNNSINAMHTQIIVHYLRRKKLKFAIPDEEMKARESLIELLERRLENGLERIFKLLELRYSQNDVRMAYKGILSDEQDKRTNAIEFLDILLNPDLKSALIPIVEATILDTTSEEVIETISKNKLTEMECFQNILDGKDVKLKLAVLYLIEKKGDSKYIELITPLLNHKDIRVKTFSQKALNVINP